MCAGDAAIAIAETRQCGWAASTRSMGFTQADTRGHPQAGPVDAAEPSLRPAARRWDDARTRNRKVGVHAAPAERLGKLGFREETTRRIHAAKARVQFRIKLNPGCEGLVPFSPLNDLSVRAKTDSECRGATCVCVHPWCRAKREWSFGRNKRRRRSKRNAADGPNRANAAYAVASRFRQSSDGPTLHKTRARTSVAVGVAPGVGARSGIGWHERIATCVTAPMVVVASSENHENEHPQAVHGMGAPDAGPSTPMAEPPSKGGGTGGRHIPSSCRKGSALSALNA